MTIIISMMSDMRSIVDKWNCCGIRRTSTTLYGCNAAHYGWGGCQCQGRCTVLNVVPQYQRVTISCDNLSLRTLLLYDVSFSHKTHQKTSGTWKKTRTHVFLRQTTRNALVVLRSVSVIHWLREFWSVTQQWQHTLGWIKFGCVHKPYP